mgnify:CR=1
MRPTIILVILALAGCATTQQRPDPPPNCRDPIWREDIARWTCYHTALEGFDRRAERQNAQRRWCPAVELDSNVVEQAASYEFTERQRRIQSIFSIWSCGGLGTSIQHARTARELGVACQMGEAECRSACAGLETHRLATVFQECQ